MGTVSERIRIFGVDPGTNIVGYGVIDSVDGEIVFVASGAIRAGKRGSPIASRLHEIHRNLKRLLEQYRPDAFALEQAFYGKSIEAAIRLGEGRGVALLCAAEMGVEVAEYPPATVKKAVAGYGLADKSQVAAVVQALLRLPGPPEPSDAADALALAVCHGHRAGF